MGRFEVGCFIFQQTEELAANYKEKLKKSEHQATEFKAKSEKLAADLDISKTYANKISLQVKFSIFMR